MIDWSCTKCGHKPLITSPATYDGWIRLELSTVQHGRAVRTMLYTLDSLECTLQVLNELSFSVQTSMKANALDSIDELREKIDGLESLAQAAVETDMEVGEQLVFEGDGYRHVLRKIKDEPED